MMTNKLDHHDYRTCIDSLYSSRAAASANVYLPLLCCSALPEESERQSAERGNFSRSSRGRDNFAARSCKQ